MQKVHDASKNNYWRNLPSIETPITQDELNRNEQSVDAIDDRVVAMDTSKANQTDMLVAIKNVTFDQNTGVFTFTKFNGTTFTLNTALEKILVNFRYDSDPESATYQQLILTMIDGTTQNVDLSALINQNEFVDSPTIRKTIMSGGSIRFDIIDGSIDGSKMQPDYLADITVQANRAVSSATSADNSAVLSQSWAEGGTHTREDEDTRNSKYYSEVASQKVSELLSNFGIEYLNGRLIFGTTFEEMYNIEVVGTRLIFTEA